MDFVAPLLLTALTVMLLGPWIALLLAPLVMTGSAAASGPAGLYARWRQLLRLDRRILVLDGLGEHASEGNRLRRAVRRSLSFAPDGSKPAACGCVKCVGDDAYIGVLRIHNAKGHYAVRTEGRDVAEVVRGFVGDLERHARSFPARPGTKRPRIAECRKETCPLRRRAKASDPVAAAA